MNNRGKTGIGTLVSIIFIAIVVFIILSFLGVNIPTLAKTALGLTEIDLVDYSQKNDEGKVAFDKLIEDIKECKNNGKKDCACDVSLNKFYKTHKLEFNKTVGKLVNIKEGNEITMAKEDINVNCFFKNNKFEIEEMDIVILFNKDFPYIPNKVLGLVSNNYKFVYDFILYKKDSKVCWLTNKVKESEIEKINYCSV